MTELLVLGLDVSTTASGAVVLRAIDDEPYRLEGAVTVKRKGPAGLDGMVEMAESIRDLTKGYRLDLVGLEDVFAFGLRQQEGETEAQAAKRAQAQRTIALDLARQGAMVEYLLHRRGLRAERWMPASWRKVALGRAVAKTMVPQAILRTFGFNAADEHQAMAFGIAAATIIRAFGGQTVDRRRASRAPARGPAASLQTRLL